MQRPEKNEYAKYYETYVSLVEETDIVAALRNQISEMQTVFDAISEEKGAFAYAAGKWTIREVIGHLSDSEKVFAYRALRFARNDQTPIEGFEQDDYVANARFNDCNVADLAEEFLLLRRANVLFFKSLTDETWRRGGAANNAEITVRALAYIMVGHVRHHVNVLKARYLI